VKDETDLTQAHQAAAGFPVCGSVQALSPLGQGLINRTYAVQAEAGDFVLQRINTSVFSHPDLIMANLARLQQAVARAGERLAPRLPKFFPTVSGDLLFRDAEGGAWRLLERIAAANPLTEIRECSQAAEIGRVLGVFHQFGAGLPVTDFHTTLPSSRNRPGYLAALEQELQHFGPMETELGALVDQVRIRARALTALQEARTAGRLHDTLVHGDPKRDNILFDAQGQRALCLIDFDTVQPGLIVRDLGDCLRSCCNRVGESGRSQQVRFDLPLAEVLLSGYVKAAPGVLEPGEFDVLFEAIRQIPLELGTRFLLDHLRGDTYFRVQYRGQNLHKARVQLALVADIERQETGLRALIERLRCL
jgi:Ser/Thr protein kinase RdoA (MazF antagonist)